jgi:hypothetical protein
MGCEVGQGKCVVVRNDAGDKTKDVPPSLDPLPNLSLGAMD